MKNLKTVLILLFLEYGLRRVEPIEVVSPMASLNPTFSGIWSAT